MSSLKPFDSTQIGSLLALYARDLNHHMSKHDYLAWLRSASRFFVDHLGSCSIVFYESHENKASAVMQIEADELLTKLEPLISLDLKEAEIESIFQEEINYINVGLVRDVTKNLSLLLQVDSQLQKCLESIKPLFELVSYSAQMMLRLDEAQQLLNSDSLTGLQNYRSLEQSLDREILRNQRYAGSFSLLFIDLDKFKPVNDKYGHLAGSYILKKVAERLQATIREVDSVFRYGGDEYVVLLVEADREIALAAAQRVQMAISSRPFELENGHKVEVGASIGVASYPQDARNKQDLIRLADQSMYKNKRAASLDLSDLAIESLQLKSDNRLKI